MNPLDIELDDDVRPDARLEPLPADAPPASLADLKPAFAPGVSADPVATAAQVHGPRVP